MSTASDNKNPNTISLDSDIQAAVRLEQIKVLYSSIPFNVLATILGAGLLVFIEWRYIEHSVLIYWFVAMLLIVAVRIGLGVSYKRSSNHSTPFWGTAFIATVLITAAAWGGAILFLFAADELVSQILLTFIILGLAAGGVTSLSYLRITGIGFITLLLVPLIIRFYFAEHEHALILSFLCLLFYVATFISALRFYKHTRENIELSYKSANDAVVVRVAKEEAERANKAKSMFLSSMSHELRTPLNAIMGFSQIMQIDSKNPLTPLQEHHVNEIMSASEHLLSLIDDILNLSQIESGEFVVTPTKVNIGEAVNDSVSFVKHMAIKKRINFIVQDNLNNYSIFVDSTRLKQVLINLLRNAIEYNNEDGEVRINAVANNGILTLGITDTGKGIAESDHANLFMPFYRLDEVNNVSGAGLGLTLSKHLVEKMGGQIGVESEPGKGSCFRVSFPLA